MMEHEPADGTPDSEKRADRTPEEARRLFLKQSLAVAALSVTPGPILKAGAVRPNSTDRGPTDRGRTETVKISLIINGKKQSLTVDPRLTLLDLLREQLALTGTKKGCDFGQCGACTVHLDGRRALSCLLFAVMQDGRSVTTIEGLTGGKPGSDSALHPMQEAFIEHDGFQCGYCTPGQIMSAVSCIREGRAGSEDEIREYMSGNLCRCGAYPNIVKAIQAVKAGGVKV